MLFVQRLAPASTAAPAQPPAKIGVTGQLVLSQAAHRAAVAHAAAVAAAARVAAARAAAARAAALRAAAVRAAARRAAELAAEQRAAQQAAERAAARKAELQQAPAPEQGAPASQPAQTQVAAATNTNAPVPSGSAQEIAQQLLGQFGWAGQFSCLNSLWERESGWNVDADNPSSGAYGIPQALPGSKMSSAGSDWQTDAATQIRWGLTYIGSTYGSPCGAWSHEVADGWY
jgi:hypothetical protein